MFELEVVIMVVGLRTETNLLDLLLLLVSLRLFLLLFLRVEELLIIYHAAHRRVGGSSDLDQIKILLIGNMHCLLIGVDTRFYVVANKANLLDTAYLIVDTMRVLFDNTTATRSGSNSCYIPNYLWLILRLLALAHDAPHSKKRAKLLKKFYIRKKNAFFFTFFFRYLHICKIFSTFAR